MVSKTSLTEGGALSLWRLAFSLSLIFPTAYDARQSAWLMGNSQNKLNGSTFGLEATLFPGDTFRVLKEKETAKFGEYRTRRLVLEAWDRLADGR